MRELIRLAIIFFVVGTLFNMTMLYDLTWQHLIMTFLASLSSSLFYFYLKKPTTTPTTSEESSSMKQQMGYLLAENEELREELKSIKSLLKQGRQRIDLDYEKEQMRIDYNAKGSLSV